MEMSVTELWNKILENTKETLGEDNCETWFRSVRPKDITAHSLRLEVPNNFIQDWIRKHYLDLLKDILQSLTPHLVDVELIVTSEPPEPEQETVVEKPKGRRWFFRPAAKPPAVENRELLGLNTRLTFDNFVVGPGNRFAHAAALAVAESPARSYNPLFIYGGVGLGKTHLMQAIGAHSLKINPNVKITYISSEKFTNELINAIQYRTTTKFREKYRHVDILLIDDIHFIAGKEATQEEFFHTFNTLYDAHKQIVLSSDRPPKEISSLEERLVSRFEWGLITDVQPPDLETRIAILKKKIEVNNIGVADDVVFFIADKVKYNIRELEGALNRVAAYSSLGNQKITIDFAHSVLKDMLSEDKKISIEDIQKRVVAYFNLRILDMKAKKRSQAIVYPRQIAMFLSRSLTDFSLPEIGEYFGGRDHTTVLHACEKVRKEIRENPKAKELIDHLSAEIKAGG
ncbi:MAG: chromosomal replication initiator protein DnaA [Candidatus Omnitrophota bacterium]